MRVQLVDPPAYTPPYDFSLAGALARAGADVELLTSRYLYGPTPPANGFRVREEFYPRATARDRGVNARRAWRAAEHVPGMLRHRRSGADVVHYQWLTLEALDSLLLATDAPRVFTSHNVLRRGEGVLRERAARMVAARSDAVITHTEDGGRALVDRFGADPARVRVIPHGAFDYLTRQEHEEPLPDDLAEVGGPRDPLVRRAAPLQGGRRADGGVPRGGGRRAVDRRPAVDAGRAAEGGGASARAAPCASWTAS